MICAFIGICWYELWLAAFLLFWGIEIYLRCTREGHVPSIEIARRSLRSCWPTLIPALLRATSIKLSAYPPPFERHIQISAWRTLVSLVSVHLRIYSWVASIQRIAAIRDGAAALFTRPEGILTLTATFIALSLFLFSRSLQGKAHSEDLAQLKGARLSPALILGYAFFAASRLVTVLVGGIGIDTRHNYGAAMGLAIALVALLDQVTPGTSHFRRRTVIGLSVLVVSANTLAFAGAGVHYERTAEFENLTVAFLTPRIRCLPTGMTVVVLGDPTASPGEVSVFSENPEWGGWLGTQLAAIRSDLHYYVAKLATSQRAHMHFEEINPNGHYSDIPTASLDLFSWVGGDLREVSIGDQTP